MEDRERRSIELRIKEAHLPSIKTLEEFDFAQSPHIPAARIRTLAEGGYLERAEPVLLVGARLEKQNCAEGVLHIDHLFARMQCLNTYEAKTNAMTRIGSNLSQVLPPPFSCE
jgi:hypothetical protein